MIVAIIVISIVLAVGLLIFFIGRAVRRANLPPKPGNPYRQKGFVAWIKNHIPTKRRLIQVYAALLYNANIKGFVSGNIYKSKTTKYMCVPGLNCYSCPGAVGACPMGALQNALAGSKTRAPYYVLGILALFGLMLARTICGFLCPVGLCQELLYKIRTPKLKKSRVTRVLSYLKYVILALAIAIPLIYATVGLAVPAFCKFICPAGTLGGAVLILVNPNNAAYFPQLDWAFTWKFGLAIAFVVASVFIFRVFCRFFCPLGAIYGFFNRFALIGVSVDKDNCTDCGLCVMHCKMDVKRVGDHECINCGECMAVCPTKAISWKGSKIFLHSSSIDEQAPTEKPLAPAEGKIKISTTVDVGDAQQTPADVKVNEQEQAPVAEEAAVTPTTQGKTKKPKKFWLELSAWAAALVVLVTALVCYNFIDVEKAYTPSGEDGVTTGYNVGDTAPDFTLKLYNTDGKDETFNLYGARGGITVVNFWATWCNPCVKELPYFIQLANKHPEITVVAVHGDSNDNVQAFINSREDEGWTDSTVLFVQDEVNGSVCKTYAAFGGRDVWPMTVIIDADGKVLYNSIKSFDSYEKLESLVLGFIQD